MSLCLISYNRAGGRIVRRDNNKWGPEDELKWGNTKGLYLTQVPEYKLDLDSGSQIKYQIPSGTVKTLSQCSSLKIR